jgi:hypothetical protein
VPRASAVNFDSTVENHSPPLGFVEGRLRHRGHEGLLSFKSPL